MERREIIFLISALFLIFGIFLFWNFSIGVDRVIKKTVLLPLEFMTAENGAIGAVNKVLVNFLKFVIPFIFISLGFGLLSLYGMKYGENKKFSLIACLVAGLVGVLMLRSLLSVFLLVGFTAGGFMVTGLGETYNKELHKWKSYRTGTNSVGKVLMLLNLLISLSVFLVVLGNLPYYENIQKEAVGGIIKNMIPSGVSSVTDQSLLESQMPPEYQKLWEQATPEQKQMILDKMRNETSRKITPLVENVFDNPKIKLLMDFGLIMIALGVWGALESLRVFLFSPIAGMVTKLGDLLTE